MAFAFGAAAVNVSCKSDSPPDSSSSSGATGDDDDTKSSSSGKTSSGGTSGQQSNANVNTTEQKFTFNGAERRYLLSKPTNFDASKKYPLVLNLHGNPARPEDELAALPFDSVTKQEAVIAYPAAANGSDWDFSLPPDNPDMPFIKGLIDELATKASIDPKRVLAYGYSGGAYFLSQYACRTPNVGSIVKLVAIVSGGAPEPHGSEDPNQCVQCPGGPVAMFIAHGMNDQTEVPFEGGDYARQCWAGTNGCTADSLVDATAPCKKYNGCTQPTEWCPVPDHGHEPWSAGMEQAWNMFKALP